MAGSFMSTYTLEANPNKGRKKTKSKCCKN